MFFYGPLIMDVPVLANQRKPINNLFADTGCNLEDLPGVMNDRDKSRERERERERKRERVRKICPVSAT